MVGAVTNTMGHCTALLYTISVVPHGSYKQGHCKTSKVTRVQLEEAIPVGFQPKHPSDNNKAENSEHKFEKLVPSAYIPTEASPLSVEGVLLAQEQKVMVK
ncbi:hypothetical protein Nepgr_013726 [Nepenthes gracilis]|uniref:Uncharacterized protein n=1 Tax=Nepenthes gracilis TaxID=150966 RepID=A0AAD3SI03_NEPGR|nr:hypothetical protein Nepgr_013726 [Nepenthes gracilis]